MKVVFSEHAWQESLVWQKTDRSMVKRINSLIREIQRTPFEGIGTLDVPGFNQRIWDELMGPPCDRESISYEPSACALIWGYVRGFFRWPRRCRERMSTSGVEHRLPSRPFVHLAETHDTCQDAPHHIGCPRT